MVLDHDYGVALLDQRVQHADEFFAVAEVQADGGLLQDVEVLKTDVAAAFAVAREAVGQLGEL